MDIIMTSKDYEILLNVIKQNTASYFKQANSVESKEGIDFFNF